MALADVQGLMARMFTDEAVRRQFFERPDAVAAAFGLTDHEIEEVRCLAQQQVAFFARMLERKRARGVGRLLPQSRRLLGPRFGELFARYAAQPAPTGPRRQRQDAVAFAAFVEKLAAAEQVLPDGALGTLRYEAASLTATEPGPLLLLRRIREPASATTWRGVRRSTAVEGVRGGLAVWVRFSRGGRVRHVVVPLP